MGAKKAEPELGSFDCVYSESGATPKVGKLHVFKTSLVFKAEMFGMDKTSVSVKRKDLDALDATSALTLKIQYKKTKSLDLQFTKSATPYDLIVSKYRLISTEREGFSVNDKNAKRGSFPERKSYAPGLGGAADRVKDTAVAFYENGNEKLKTFLRDASRLGGAKIPPTPRLPTTDCEETVSRCLFVRVIGAKDLLAMDSGGTSDPFVVARYRGSEISSRTIPLTTNPQWDETFTFNAPPGKEELDDSDEVELMVYDRDFGGLNDFIGFCKINMAGVKVSDGDVVAPRAKRDDDKATGKKAADATGRVSSVKAKNDGKKSGETNAFLKESLKKPLLETRRDAPGTSRRRREWIKLAPMPKDHGDAKSFDLNHVKERLMFWEGERAISGAIEVETWVGNRHDEAFRVAGVPALIKPDTEAETSLAHYVDPVTALLRVEIKKGRNIMNLDDDGGSDPYCEVALVDPKSVKPEQSQATHYIDDATDPEWDRAFNFIVSKPYTDDLELRVYDYDGATAFDDLIGKAVLSVRSLSVHRGLRNPPEERWIALVDKEGKDANDAGEKYGDVLVRAYLDEEYFEHLHGGDTEGRVGRLSVDVMGADGLETPVTTHCVVKCGPYWTRLPNVENSVHPKWNQRLRYPVFDPGERVTVALFEGAAASAKYLGRVKLQLSTMEDGVRYASKFQLMTQGSFERRGDEDVRVARRSAVRLRSGRLESSGEVHAPVVTGEVVLATARGRRARSRDQKPEGDAGEETRRRVAADHRDGVEDSSRVCEARGKHRVHQELGGAHPTRRRGVRQDWRRDDLRALLGLGDRHRRDAVLDRVPGVLPQHVRAHRLARHRRVVARAVPGPVPARVGPRAGGRVAQPGRALPAAHRGGGAAEEGARGRGARGGRGGGGGEGGGGEGSGGAVRGGARRQGDAEEAVGGEEGGGGEGGGGEGEGGGAEGNLQLGIAQPAGGVTEADGRGVRDDHVVAVDSR
jgi:hypothetical protein